MIRCLACAVFLLFVSSTGSTISAQEVAVSGSEGAPEARGVVRAPRRIALSSRLGVTVLSVPKSEGDLFEEGEPLLVFDCKELKAERAALAAAHHAASVELKQKRHLLKFGAAGRGEVDLAQAHANRSWAEVTAMDARLDECRVDAPFSGRVAELGVRAAQRAPVGEPLMTIIDNSSLEVELVVPSVWLRWLETGMAFSFTIDETGLSHEASIDRIGAEVDPVSQTVKLYGVLVEGQDRVLAGMSGAAFFAPLADNAMTSSVQ